MESHSIRRNRRDAALVGVFAFVLSAVPATVAYADDPLSVEQGVTPVAEIAPEIIHQTDDLAPIERDEVQSQYSTGFEAEVAAQAAIGVSRASSEMSGTMSPDVTIKPEYFTQYEDTYDGIDVWRTDSDSVVGYAQPLANGLRFMAAIADASAPEAYAYSLNLPPNSTMKENETGFGLWDAEGASLGQLQRPWAIDSNGKALATSFEWDGATLTQHVDLSDSEIEFPVLIDPAWTYSYDYFIMNSTPEQVRAKLKDCFNCWFPVEGAPRGYPSQNQFLPLVVRPFAGAPISWNFNCRFGFDLFEYIGHDPTVGRVTHYMYVFTATSDHVDGAGSTISFEWNSRKLNGIVGSTMTVSAYIVNDNPMGLGRPAYTIGANYNWTQFANRLSGIQQG